MNKTDMFYLDCTAGAVANLFTPGADGTPYLHDESIRTYIDPIEFERYIASVPKHDRPGKFKRAYDVVIECIEQCCQSDEVNGILVTQIYKDVLICLHTLATEICPEAAAGIPTVVDNNNAIATDTPQVEIITLPSELDSPHARKLLRALFEADYLDSNYQPLIDTKRKTLAYIAKYIGLMLSINWDKVFTDFWSLSRPLSQDFLNINRMTRDRELPVTNDKDAEPINRILAPIVRADQILKLSYEGKKLLKVYKN